MYVLHGVPDWGSQVVRMALEELDLPYRFAAVDWQAGGLASPEFAALSPFARVPVLETPDGPMFETGAILLYLTEHHGRLAPAATDSGRAQFLIWFIFVCNQLHPTAMTQLHPEQHGGQTAQVAVASRTHDLLRIQLGALEKVAASGVWWLSPDRPSAISLFVLMLLRWIKAFPAYAEYSIASADYPALHRMAQGLERRAGVQRVLAAEGIAGPAPFSDPPCETVPEAA